MRILWFTNTPSNYLHGTNAYNGGGWISSLETEIKKLSNVELGIAFQLNGHPQKVERDGVIYYPIVNPYIGSINARIKRYVVSHSQQHKYFMGEYLRVIDDFNPDIINIFGTEKDFGLVAQYTNIPIVIHIQGLLIPYFTAFFPPGYSLYDYLTSDWNPIKAYRRWKNYLSYKHGAVREQLILKCNSHFIGRTDWDRKLTSIYNSQASYDYCSEILRNAFYKYSEHKLPNNLVITTTISSPLYKGYDVILKCAKILKYQLDLDFEWRVFGNINPKFVERKENLKAIDVNVRLMGVATQNELCQSIMESTIYVHPSYIDNSPNSVCEAQMLGCTVIGQNVGGMSSLIKQNETGVLVPANDPYQMAYAIKYYFLNPSENKKMGEQASDQAHERHNKDIIINDLLNIYYKYKIK